MRRWVHLIANTKSWILTHNASFKSRFTHLWSLIYFGFFLLLLTALWLQPLPLSGATYSSHLPLMPPFLQFSHFFFSGRLSFTRLLAPIGSLWAPNCGIVDVGGDNHLINLCTSIYWFVEYTDELQLGDLLVSFCVSSSLQSRSDVAVCV
jgi:hypothetical protein